MSEIRKEDYFNVGLKFRHMSVTYEVLKIGSDGLQVYLGYNDSGRIGSLWWTPSKLIGAILVDMPPFTPYSRVIAKIKQIDDRRKQLGYRW